MVYNLRDSGFDIRSVDEDFKGLEDSEVIDKAVGENRVLTTFDRDFSDPDVSSHPGIIRITSVANKEKLVEMIKSISQSFSSQDFENSVVEVSPSDY